MKVCRIKPDDSTCFNCKEWDMFTNYELLGIGVGTMFRRDYAMILKDGKVQRVPLSNVYDIREV